LQLKFTATVAARLSSISADDRDMHNGWRNVLNHLCKGAWLLTTSGWIMTRRFTPVASLIISLSNSELVTRDMEALGFRVHPKKMPRAGDTCQGI
jgi:hypothetical protein